MRKVDAPGERAGLEGPTVVRRPEDAESGELIGVVR